jgi:hypothetical protein
MICKETVMIHSKSYPGICLEGLNKTTINKPFATFTNRFTKICLLYGETRYFKLMKEHRLCFWTMCLDASLNRQRKAEHR